MTDGPDPGRTIREGTVPVSFHGELQSIPLGDVLQTLEGGGRSGTLSLTRDGTEVAFVRLEAGRLASLQRPDRPDLVERLVLEGHLSREELRNAKQKRRGSRKSLVEVIQLQERMSSDEIRAVAATALTEDFCDLVAETHDGEFHLDEGPVIPRMFDAEERSLELGLGIGPLLLEAARRADHWSVIRQAIPSDATHYCVSDREMNAPLDAGDPELVRAMITSLDGTRAVHELSDQFPGRRFEVYTALAHLVRERTARPAEGDELLRMAQALKVTDAERARIILDRGLIDDPHHRGLLELHAEVTRGLRDRSGAAQTLKTIAHLAREEGDLDRAREALEDARTLAPRDPAVLTRVVELAVVEGRLDVAKEAGLKLVEVHRGPGLHTRARDVLVELLKHHPNDVDLTLELATCLVDADQPGSAVKALTRTARECIDGQAYTEARRLYEKVLEIDPSHFEAAERIEELSSNVFSHRLARRHRWLVRTAAILTFAAVISVAWTESRARQAYAAARNEIGDLRLIEQGDYAGAISRLEAVRAAHPLTPTVLFDVPFDIEDLEVRRANRR
ncbi:MAG: DUF4388 domain-containing protein [Planctomycetota bacterium]